MGKTDLFRTKMLHTGKTRGRDVINNKCNDKLFGITVSILMKTSLFEDLGPTRICEQATIESLAMVRSGICILYVSI